MKAIAAHPGSRHADSRAFTTWLAITILAPLGAGAWIAAGEPSGPACLLREIAHVDCPTCGITRALALLARGEWAASLFVHPGAALLLAQAIVFWVAWTRWLFRGGSNPEGWIPRIVLADAAGLMALWILRLATGTLPG